MSLIKKSFPLFLISFLLGPLGCSKKQSVSDLSRILYTQYHEHLLDVRYDHYHQIMVIYRLSLKQATKDSIQNLAFHLAKTAYKNFADSSEIDSVIIRFQSIGAPTVINEKDAENFPFHKRELR